MTIKKLALPILIFSCLSAFSQISFGDSKKINDNWKFTLQDASDAQNTTYDDANWQSVNVPHDWSVEGRLSPTLASCMGYLPGGIGWYRKTLNIPQNKRGEKVYLYFEGVYNRSEVFINGHSLGKRPNGYISFAYDATPFVKYGEDNIIAVRVDHSKSADSRWYSGSGIYRNVWLVYSNPVHIEQWGVYTYPEVANGTGTLNVEVALENGSAVKTNLTVVNELLDNSGKTVAKSSQKVSVEANAANKTAVKINVKNPQLWDLEHPNLYQLKTTVLKDGKPIDKTVTSTGFRNFTFDANKGFALNGKWMKMKGVCLHHDAGVLGSAVPKDVLKSRLKTLKEIGVNAIRTSHNPQAPDFYALCDELGILVLNEAYDEWEFPKRKWLTGWNVGTPGFEGSNDIFVDWGEKDLEDMVRRDRNHLSVFGWSIGNEVDYPNDPYSHPVLDKGTEGFGQANYGGYKKDAPDAMRLGGIAKRLVAAVKKYDKSRPTTAGLAGVAMSNETEYPGALDITGYNYTESKYASDHKKYPNRVIFGSENVHDMGPWLAVKNNEHIFGQFLWTGIDYLGESNAWPSRGFYSGLVDFAGIIKPRGYFRQSLWSDKPMIFAGTYISNNEKELSKDAWPIWNNYNEGEMIRVVCYTNAAKARLELNGKVVGEEKNYDEKTGVIYWDIPFASGKLEAIGLSNDNKIESRYSIVSSQQPYALVINDKNITVNKDGVAKVIVQVLDEKGLPVMLSDNEITCTISGSGTLLGLEAGNNSDMGDYTDNVQRAFHGHLVAYIQATEGSEPIKVKFTSTWLKPTEVSIQVK